MFAIVLKLVSKTLNYSNRISQVIGWLAKCINTKFVYSSTAVYELCRYAKLPNNASNINPMPDWFLTKLKEHIDCVLQ